MNVQTKYQDIIKRLDKGYSIIKTMRPLPPDGVQYFMNEFSISTTHSSNAIEGNTFTYDETKLLIEKGITSNVHSYREHADIMGYKQGFDYLYKALKNGNKIDEEFIKKLHSYVLQGEDGAGEYRTIQNYVGDLVRVAFTPCSPNDVPSKMNGYIKELNDDFKKYSNTARASEVKWNELFQNLAKHHIEFERIHPFADGNGRTGRLLLTYEIISMGLLPVDIRYEERKRYYAALAAYDDKAKYSTRSESKTEKMAKLLAENELRSVDLWIKTFSNYANEDLVKSEINQNDK